jgi:hypothetical protein
MADEKIQEANESMKSEDYSRSCCTYVLYLILLVGNVVSNSRITSLWGEIVSLKVSLYSGIALVFIYKD